MAVFWRDREWFAVPSEGKRQERVKEMALKRKPVNFKTLQEVVEQVGKGRACAFKMRDGRTWTIETAEKQDDGCLKFTIQLDLEGRRPQEVTYEKDGKFYHPNGLPSGTLNMPTARVIY